MIQFTKAHALGNDFMILAWPQPALTAPTMLNKMTIQNWGDRHRGIGFDQLILYHLRANNEVEVLFYNVDGSQAQACGNGYRALAKHLCHTTGETSHTMHTTYGKVYSQILEDGQIQLRLPPPVWSWREIPQSTPLLGDLPPIGGMIAPYITVNVGNPHLIVFIEDLSEEMINSYAPLLEKHALFPEHINVSFARPLSATDIQLRVWERGVGYTHACGTAACATACAAIRHGFSHAAKSIWVHQPGGALNITWDDTHLWLTGDAACVYQGVLYPSKQEPLPSSTSIKREEPLPESTDK